jgi:hypothetical protein
LGKRCAGQLNQHLNARSNYAGTDATQRHQL